MATESPQRTVLVYGSTGWIGGKLLELLAGDPTVTAVAGKERLENRAKIEAEIDHVSPSHVLNAAGLTGRPNVDWCEDNKEAVNRVNVVGMLNLADVCSQRKLHLTTFATGCIYSYDKDHSIGGRPFTEEDAPNFNGSYYSKTKAMVEEMLKAYEGVLVLRLRMPISDDLSPRNFVTKITKYAKVVNIPNSMSVLTDLLPVSLQMSARGLTGIYNFTNPGAISHNDILGLYKQYIDPEFTWTNFTEEEQNLILKAKRSNNTLDASKLVAAVPDITIPPITESIVRVFERMQANLGISVPKADE